MVPSSYNQVVVDLKAVTHNYKILSKKVGPDVNLLAMVKGDGYGHGMLEIAKALQLSGCNIYGVAEMREAVLLRKAEIEGEIYVMVCPNYEQYPLFFTHNLTPVVMTLEAIEKISKEAQRSGQDIGVHLKVDSGMCRLGCFPHEVGGFVSRIKQLPRIFLAGIISHLPKSDECDSSQTFESLASFKTANDNVGNNYKIISHIANSGGVLNFPDTHADMVRPGISLYGYYPDGALGRQRACGEKLIPAMTFTSQVLQVKKVPAGTGVSYGHTYITERETKLAVIPVGYEDGYPRSLSNRGEVLIRGCRAKIRGRVCMNLCMADITDINSVEVGDDVVLLGEQGAQAITADEIADATDTISYEILCMIGNNNERSYIS